MSYTAENGNFEGRSRPTGGFGNETGQTERRGRSGEAAEDNQRAMGRRAGLDAPAGSFKSARYRASPQNLAKLAQMVGPMIAAPGIGLAAPLADAIINGNPYGAFGIPDGWSTYSPRDINPMGHNPRGNIGARDAAGNVAAMGQAQRLAAHLAALRQQQSVSRTPPIVTPGQPQPYAPVAISDQVPGLPLYGTATQGYGKAGGYGGVPRAAATGFADGYF